MKDAHRKPKTTDRHRAEVRRWEDDVRSNALQTHRQEHIPGICPSTLASGEVVCQGSDPLMIDGPCFTRTVTTMIMTYYDYPWFTTIGQKHGRSMVDREPWKIVNVLADYQPCATSYYPPLPTIANHYQTTICHYRPLPTIINQLQRFSIIINNSQPLSNNSTIVNQCSSLSTIFNTYQPLSIIVNSCQWTIFSHCQPLSTSINHYQPFPTIMNNCQPLLTSINYCHPQRFSTIVNHYSFLLI